MKSYAQAGQDTFVHDLIGDTGYFVDVGAHDGIVHSNTYALEQLGWDGVCVEPNADAFNALMMSRLAGRSRIAISDHLGTVQFDGVRVGVGDAIECETLTSLLETFEAPPVIDYLSIDVEGHELEVLAGMDFARWRVRLITIEHNLYLEGPGRKNAIFDYLTELGFERVREDVVAEGYGPYEDWYRNGD